MQNPQTNPAVWFEIYVDDMTRAKSFYQAVLGCDFQSLQDPTEDAVPLQMEMFDAAPDAPGIGGALVHTAEMPAGGNSTVVYFGCNDCAIEAARVENAGGMLLKDKFSIGDYGFCAIAKDSEGNMIGLHSMQ